MQQSNNKKERQQQLAVGDLLFSLFHHTSHKVFTTIFLFHKHIALWHFAAKLLAQFLKQSHCVFGELVSLPCACVGDEHPALAVGIAQD